MQQPITLLKARTILMKNGIRINFRNVSYVEFIKGPEHYIFTIRTKYKASVVVEELHYANLEVNLDSFFKQFGMARLSENTYVNLHKILTIKEEVRRGPVDKTKVEMFFTDGYKMVRVMDSTAWTNWKNTYA